MTTRARQDLHALSQAQRVRDVQTDTARTTLDQALLSLNSARQDLETARARQAADLEQWGMALAIGALDIGAARYWPIAVGASQAVVETCEKAVEGAVGEVDAARDAWRAAMEKARAVARPLKQARRRLDRAIDERRLSEASDRFLMQGVQS